MTHYTTFNTNNIKRETSILTTYAFERFVGIYTIKAIKIKPYDSLILTKLNLGFIKGEAIFIKANISADKTVSIYADYISNKITNSYFICKVKVGDNFYIHVDNIQGKYIIKVVNEKEVSIFIPHKKHKSYVTAFAPILIKPVDGYGVYEVDYKYHFTDIESKATQD